MKRILGTALSQLAAVGMISVSLLPVCDLAAFSKNNCCEEEECCAPACDSNVWCWLGGALLGAAAGAGTGYAASQDGKRGRTGDPGDIGPIGPVGPAGTPGATGATGATGAPGTFPVDTGETLTFNQAFLPTLGDGATVTPFVSQPDGTVLLGAPITITLPLSNIVFPPFVITDPQFGEYNAGIQIDSTLIPVTGLLTQNAVSTRDSSTTLFGDMNAVTALIGTQYQENADFVYPAPPVF